MRGIGGEEDRAEKDDEHHKLAYVDCGHGLADRRDEVAIPENS